MKKFFGLLVCLSVACTFLYAGPKQIKQSPLSESQVVMTAQQVIVQDKDEMKKKVMIIINGAPCYCDVAGCMEPVENIWFDSESGSRAYRCAKHK